MAKLTCLLALFVVVVVCAEAVRIDTAQKSEGRPIPRFKKNDPRCKKDKNEMFAISNDCKKYLKCDKGNSRERNCPENQIFDFRRHCISPERKPMCKPRKTLQAPTDADPWCPRPGGTYTLPDCRKYFKCDNYKATVITCPKGMFYSKVNVRCIKADKCPNPKSEEGEKSKCPISDGLLPDPKNCRKYIKCVNFHDQSKTCPPGKAFSTKSHVCTKAEFEKCKNNDILHIEPDEE